MAEIQPREYEQNDYISRSEILSKARYGQVSVFDIVRAPAVNVKLVNRGKWIRYSDNESICSECGAKKQYDPQSETLPPFCEQCGAELNRQ